MRTLNTIVVLATTVTLAVACGDKGEDDGTKETSETEGTGGSTGTGGGTGGAATTGKISVALKPVGAAAATLALAGEQTKSFRPVSYKIPIKNIYASEQASSAIGTQSGSGRNLYECTGTTEAACQIDLLDPALATTLASPVDVPAATYKSIGYSVYCGSVPTSVNTDGQGIHVAVKGTMTIGGTTYYTTSGAEVLTTDATKYEHATVAMGGCGGKVFNLDQDLVVAAGSSNAVTLLLATENLAWASRDSQAALPAGCVTDGAQTGVCSSIPPIIPAVGTFTTTLERYVVDSPAYCGKGLVQFVLDSSTGTPLGVYLSRHYNETAVSPGSCWDAGVDKLSKNADGSYTIGSDTTATGVPPRVLFSAFQRAAHSGTLDHAQGSTTTTGAAYTAIVAP